MDIIDGQIHVYRRSTPERPWPATTAHVHASEYLIEDALAVMEPAGVRKAILIPPGWVGFDNSYSLEIARASPDRFAVMGRFDIEHPQARSMLASYMEPGMAGMRPVFTYPSWETAAADTEFDWFWRGCSVQGIPLMCFFPDLAICRHLATRFPALKITIDHAGRIPRTTMDEAAWTNIDDLLALAKYPNVMVKLSSLPCFTTQPFPFPVLHEPIRLMVDAFGPQRLIWGSDVTRLTCLYGENVRLFTEALDFLGAEDLEWIMGGTLAGWCGWDAVARSSNTIGT